MSEWETHCRQGGNRLGGRKFMRRLQHTKQTADYLPRSHPNGISCAAERHRLPSQRSGDAEPVRALKRYTAGEGGCVCVDCIHQMAIERKGADSVLWMIGEHRKERRQGASDGIIGVFRSAEMGGRKRRKEKNQRRFHEVCF